MLENFKSPFNIIILFQYINDKKKLLLIKYNKYLQNILHIKIINYKIMSKRYIIYETYRKGREYNSYNDALIYEGEYIKGKRSGLGKEFYFDKVIFEGEYLNGKRNGKGTEYYNNGLIKFDGEYLYGKKWNGNGYDINHDKIYELKNGNGLIKEYSMNGNLILKGQYKNGELNGKIKEYYYDETLKFEGEYMKGIRSGFGKEYNRCGKLSFEGEYCYGKKWNGKGFDEFNNIIYEIKNGNGLIKETYFGKITFEGEYINGERNGKGKIYENNKLVFEGDFLNGKRNGKAKLFDKKGKLKFDGLYLYDYKINGKEFIKGKLEFEGDYLFDKKWNGKGYDNNGNLIYELNNGNGNVKLYDYKGELFFEGEYINGKKVVKSKNNNFNLYIINN